MNIDTPSPLRRRRLAALAGVAALGLGLGLAGCGDSSSPAASADTTATAASTGAATTSADATTAVTDAYKALHATSYTSTTTTTQDLSTEGVDGAVKEQILAKMKASVNDSTATAKVESPQRAEVVSTTTGKDTTIVMYDGATYVSANGGKTWAQVTGDAEAAINSAQSAATTDPTALFTDLQDAGPATVGGQAGTKYTGGVSSAKTQSLLNTVFGSLGSQIAEALGSAMKIKDGKVAVVVGDANGMVIQQVMDYGITFDLAALASAGGASNSSASGTIVDTVTATETIDNIGDPVTITEPTATKKVSDILQLGMFLAK